MITKIAQTMKSMRLKVTQTFPGLRIKGFGDFQENIVGTLERGSVKHGRQVVFLPTHTAAKPCGGQIDLNAYYAKNVWRENRENASRSGSSLFIRVVGLDTRNLPQVGDTMVYADEIDPTPMPTPMPMPTPTPMPTPMPTSTPRNRDKSGTKSMALTVKLSRRDILKRCDWCPLCSKDQNLFRRVCGVVDYGSVKKGRRVVFLPTHTESNPCQGTINFNILCGATCAHNLEERASVPGQHITFFVDGLTAENPPQNGDTMVYADEIGMADGKRDSRPHADNVSPLPWKLVRNEKTN